ncbi:MAG TPA: DUF3267 domain-containing protein [Anaerolineaceae bacterium]|nr:DUF3267 domain-containing protein [Anaerolineaceae bacterium]
MRATKTLPAGYTRKTSLDLSKNKFALVLMNLLGFVSLFAFGWLFLQAAAWLRPDATWNQIAAFQIFSLKDLLNIIVLLIGESAAVVVLHEATHGLFFWIFGGERPRFGLRGAYAFASMPDVFFPRPQYIVIGLAPLVLLSLLGLALIAFVPRDWVFAIWLFLIFNASGAIGDILTVVWLLFQPGDVLVQDLGDAVTLYSYVPVGSTNM